MAVGDDGGVWIAGDRGLRCRLRACDLFGGGEGVEGHGVGLVADGVEAELEAGGGALGGHLVELVLVVAGDAGVGGVVGVGSGEGGGAGAEGAVHEAFEHGRVEEGVVGVVAGAALLRVSRGRLKSSHSETRRWSWPSCSMASRTSKSSQSEKSWTEVTPWERASAMARSRALRRRVGVGRRDVRLDEGEGGGFADDAGGVAGGVEVDLAAGGVGGGGGDAGGGEGGGVGDGDVAVGAVEDGGVAGGDGVEVLAGGEGFA